MIQHVWLILPAGGRPPEGRIQFIITPHGGANRRKKKTMLNIKHVTSVVSPGDGETKIFAVTDENLVYVWDVNYGTWNPYSDVLEKYAA